MYNVETDVKRKPVSLPFAVYPLTQELLFCLVIIHRSGGTFRVYGWETISLTTMRGFSFPAFPGKTMRNGPSSSPKALSSRA
jgi:hypothetical protein